MLIALPVALAASDAASVMQHFDEHFELGQRTGCLTALVAELKANWSDLTPGEQARVAEALGAKGATLDLPDNGGRSGFADDTCFGQVGSNRVTGDHFVVEWDSVASSRVAEALLDSMELGYEVEVDEYGWRAPDGDGNYLMLVYITDEEMSGAYTSVSSCGGGYLPYIVFGSDSANWGGWTEIAAAHEFNHALQFGYSYAPELWWWEATATWIEEIVYPTYSYWADYVTGYTENPHLAMQASSQQDYEVFYHMYGMAIWAFYLSEYHGGPDTIRQIWENAANERNTYMVDEMVEELDLDWHATYLDFVAHSPPMDYEDHRVFPDLAEHELIEELPADGASSGRSEPEGYGQNFIRFEAGSGEGDLVIAFDGDSDVAWGLVLAEVSSDELLRSVTAIVDEGEGQGAITLEYFGEEDVVLIVTPLDDDDEGREYAWTAETKESAPDSEDDDDDEDDSSANGDESVGLVAACGCATGGVGPPMAAGLVALAALAVRRRS